MRFHRTSLIKGFILLIIFASVAIAFDNANPDPSPTGVAPVLFCANCHRDFPINAGYDLGGDFYIDERDGIDLFKNGYVPGRTYNLRAIIAQPEMTSWGFDAWVVDANGATAGRVDGFPERTIVFNAGGVRRVTNEIPLMPFRHEDEPEGPVGWRFSWTAPATNIGPVTFFGEGIAANGDHRQTGDYRYVLDGIVVPPAEEVK
jgi:hypothetical protein